MLTRKPIGGYRSKRTVQTRVHPLPAPLGGWNRRDSVTAIPETDAIVLDNMVPTARGIVLRKGYQEHASGISGNYVESLMPYVPQSGNGALFACGPTDIYDVTSAAAVGAAAVSGLTNGRWSHVNVSTLGGHYLLCANGADSMRIYDGSSWATASITGVTTADIDALAVHMQRVWLIERNSMSVWYLGIGAIAGAATEFDLGPVSRYGGHLVAMASWTRDGGAGLDDVAVFITSAGEALIYSGSDPDSANTWAFVGSFRIPEPLGRQCVVKLGADVGIITTQGVVALSAILPLAAAGTAQAAATDKIREAYNEIVAVSRDFHGWQIVESPEEQMLIVNIPVAERVTAYQYVMHTATGAWCRFTGINAGCWAYFDGGLYFGGHDGTVNTYAGARDDNADEIDGVIQHAFSAMGTANTKIIDRVRPITFGPSHYIPGVGVRLDYDDAQLSISASPYQTVGPEWDRVYWDQEYWGEELVPGLVWQMVAGEGMVASVAVAIASSESVTYNGCLVSYRTGGPY